MRRTVDILGVPVDAVTADEAVARAAAWLQGAAERPAHIVTANPEMVMLAREHAGLAAALQDADLVVADGIGVVWAARLLRQPLPHRIPGIDLTSRLLDVAAQTGAGVFLLGARPGVAEEAARRLKEKHPGLVIAGTHHGYLDPGDEERVVRQINASGAALLLVAMGVPRQELWIARHRDRLAVRLLIGVGGAFDVYAGRVRRAPKWLQELGLEWAYRVLQEPRRLTRLAALPRFVLLAVKAALSDRGRQA